jgi:chromosome segregation ATPase
MTLRSEHLSKEAELTARNDALQQELSLVQAEEKKLDEELATLSGQLDFFTQNVADYEAQQQKFDEIKKEMEGVKSDIVELKTKKAFLDKVSEESSSSLKEAKKAYNKVKEAYDTIISEKAEKEKARDEAIKAAEARRTNAMKEKEILAGKIAKCHEELANQDRQDKDALHASEARVVAASKKLKIRIEQKEEARACSDKLRKEWKDSYDVQVARLRELKELSSKFEAASNAEIDRLAMLKKERIESRLEHVEKRRSDLALIEDAQKADINNIKKKLDRLRAVNKLKALIAESKIDLSKNGTYDRFVMPNLDEIDFGCPDTDDWSQ